MPITKLTPENNYPYLQERLEALEQVVPEAFADGRINWDVLRELLGEKLEDEARDEYFGLNWPGKREARKRAATPSRATLVPAPGEGVNENTTENLFIEGDNLEVLKLLQKSYAGKIKMIFIDPPYNTSNDFIYNDNFTDPLEAYLDYTGSRGESGELLTTNTRADGRFHSKWLNMMYPRLILARQMLRDDGVIFVSIDDNEVHHLIQMMNEVFGEENFISDVVWKHTQQSKNDERFFSRQYNNILVFSKTTELDSFRFERSDNDNVNYANPDNDPNGLWRSGDVRSPNYRKTLCFDIKTPNGNIISAPANGWRWTLESIQQKINTGEIIFNEDQTKIIRKIYLKNQEGRTPENIWDSETYGTTRNANAEIKELFGDFVFDTPKPTALLMKMMDLFNGEADYLVLDFFAGSASTAHAVIRMNLKDNGKRKFIMVQFPQSLEKQSIAYKAGLSNICEIGKERVRRVIKNENSKVAEKTPLLQDDQPQVDLGFKVFQYTRSNFKQWRPLEEENAEALTPLFDNLSDPLVQGWKKEDLLSEILLLEGFPLTSKVTYLEDHLKNEVYRVSAPDFCAHDLFVCLDETIHPATVELLTMDKGDIFVCLDSALSDELKARVQDQFNVHVI